MTELPATREELEERWSASRHALTDREWIRLWRRLGRHDRDDLPPTIKVYRGATREGRRGMSWTHERSTAQHYARLAGGQLWSTTVDAADVLGVVSGYELVIDPARLGKVTEVTTPVDGTRPESYRESTDRRAEAVLDYRTRRNRADRAQEQDFREGLRSGLGLYAAAARAQRRRRR